MEKIFTSPRDLKKSDVVQPSVMMKDDMKSQFIRPRSSILDMPYIDPGIYEHTDDESSVCSSFFSNDGEEVHTEPQVRRNSSHESTFIVQCGSAGKLRTTRYMETYRVTGIVQKR